MGQKLSSKLLFRSSPNWWTLHILCFTR